MFSSPLNGLFTLSNMVSRSISPENPRGEKGKGGLIPAVSGTASHAARDLGDGWKTNPYIHIEAGETVEIADIDGPGVLQHIWLTPTGTWRDTIIRMYWDGAAHPSVECPIGDFFCAGWGEYAQVSSLPVCVNPGSAFNCYWPMPFRKHCRITLENRAPQRVTIYFQIDYALGEIDKNCAYFHARFSRVNPLPYKSVYTILDGVKGRGQYVGTYMNWGSNSDGWWGEGEIKFYIDGDREAPTICGTGTEDYFCGSYNFENPFTHDSYVSFTTPYSGFYQVRGGEPNTPGVQYKTKKRFGLYRFHVMDPIRFDEELSVTIQALGWRSEGRYLPLQDDLSSVAFWYQEGVGEEFPALPDRDALEII